ncbi:DoxX family protein [Solihabitans fulvus]|uniref:DoxX family protein n=1 Tax=Solihabitans fulvus TaxID=1892852 RepID=UPI001CB75D1C|nr:DoxX family protein [Solihabitans fulvus]
MTTATIGFTWLSGGVADLIHRPETLEGMVKIGYPPYILTILGFWKIAGAVAILAPRFPRLKEWAYAGTFFELTGAVASHAFSGSSAQHLIWPGLFALCSVVSWALRPQSRTIGTLFPAMAGKSQSMALAGRRVVAD